MDIRLSARGLTFHEGKVLLNEFNHGEAYNIPGGKVEVNESLEDTVIREVKEETGLDVEVDCFILIYEYIPNKCNFIYGYQHHVSHIYLCSLKGNMDTKSPSIPDIDPINPDNKHTGSRWVNIEEIKSINLVPKINKTLYNILLGKEVSTQIIREGDYID